MMMTTILSGITKVTILCKMIRTIISEITKILTCTKIMLTNVPPDFTKITSLYKDHDDN